MPFVNFSIAQFCSAGCSSFRKIPRYLTVGVPCEHPELSTKMSLCFVAGTSAHLHPKHVRQHRRIPAKAMLRTNTKETGLQSILAISPASRRNTRLRTELLRVIIHSIDRPALVRANDDISALHAGKGIRDFFCHECLPLALDRRHIELRPVDNFVDER